jgi:hypothetical protein
MTALIRKPLKAMLSVVVVGGALLGALGLSAPAQAGVAIGIGIGVPGFWGYYPPPVYYYPYPIYYAYPYPYYYGYPYAAPVYFGPRRYRYRHYHRVWH